MLLLVFLPVAASQDKKIEYRCIRWTWSGDVYNRKVVCLQWEKVVPKNNAVVVFLIERGVL
jgi:hypothetical protein